MSPERFKQVEAVFQAAAGVEPGARREFVRGRCGEDAELRERVLALLEHHDAGGVEPGGEFQTVVRDAVEEIFDAPPSAPPTRIGSYRILRPLGEGGFGVVYLAEQDHPRRTVALKLLRTAFASGEIARRFEYEARILARLRHPGIAQIYEAGSAEVRVTDATGAAGVMSQPFLALEYVAGPNLIAFVLGDGGARAPLPVRDRLALFARVCDALQHAHQNGIIHRDLKPDNILVACEGPGSTSADAAGTAQPKLLDFGVARVRDADPDLTRAQTAAGRMIGTLAYMSPEQIAGDTQSVDTRSDIYAMGVLLYQLLSGRLPYEVRDVPLDEAVRIVREREPTPIRALERALRADAHAVIQKAMAKDRERRYPSMAEFAADVRRLLSGEPVAAKGDSRWYVLAKTVKRHRVALGVATAFVVVLVSSSIVGWLFYASAQSARLHSAALLRESYLNEARATRTGNGVGRRFGATQSLRNAAALRMGPDLRSEAIAALCVADFRLLREFPRGVGAIPARETASALGLAHIDRLALIGEDRSIRVVSVESGQDICRIPALEVAPTHLRFSESGEFLGASLDTDAGTIVAVWSLPTPQPILRRTIPRTPADFAFGALRGKPWVAVPQAGGGLELLALPSGERLGSLAAGGDSPFIAVSPDGSRLALLGARYKEITILDASSGAQLAECSSDSSLHSPSWSPDGRIVGAGGGDSRIHLWDAATGQALPSLEGHRATVAALVVGSELIASAGWDGTVRLWDARARAEAIAPLQGTELLGFDGRCLAVSGDDTVRVLVLADDSPRRVLHAVGPLGAQSTIEFNAGSSLMGVAGTCGVQIWDTRTWRAATLTSEAARSVMFPGDGETVVALVGGELRRWDLRTAWGSKSGDLPYERLRSDLAGAWASLSPDGSGAVVWVGGRVLLVDLHGGAVTQLAADLPNVERPVIDASGRWLFVGTWRGGPARVVDLGAGTTALSLDQSSVRGVFSPDGTLLSAGLPGRQLVFDAGRWESPREFQGREPGLATVAGASAVSPDGALMAYVEPPHVLRLADPRSATILATLPNAERYGIPDLRFSPDGRTLAVLTLEEVIIVWRIDQLRDALEDIQMGW